MKLYNPLLISALLLGLVSASGASDRNPFGNGELPEILKPFDVDADGKLSEEERQAFIAAMRAGDLLRPDDPNRPLNPWDTDGDGVLSAQEKAAAQEAIRVRIAAQRSQRFDELDKDENSFLSVEELEAIPGIREGYAARILTNLDKNSDARVSREEFLNALRPTTPGSTTPPPGTVPPPAP